MIVRRFLNELVSSMGAYAISIRHVQKRRTPAADTLLNLNLGVPCGDWRAGIITPILSRMKKIFNLKNVLILNFTIIHSIRTVTL